MGQSYDGGSILYITVEKYLSLGTGTTEAEQKSQKEYKDYKTNFTKWICHTQSTL